MRRLALCALVPLASFAQYTQGLYPSFGVDAQRTHWNKSETELSPDTVKNLKLEWSIRLDNAPMGLHSLTAPVARAWVYTPRGVRDLVVVGGSSGKLWAIDSHTGMIYWQKTLAVEGTPQRGSTWLLDYYTPANRAWITKKDLGGRFRNALAVRARARPRDAADPFQHSWGAAPDLSLMAFKVEDRGGRPLLTPVWQSVNMMLPAPAVIANGMLFVLADGDNPTQLSPGGALYSVEERRKMSVPAVLYALDAATGRTLWSSGDAMKSFSHFSGIAVAGGRVFVPTYDGTPARVGQVEEALSDRIGLLALDEFEALELAFERALDPHEILGSLRHLAQHRTRLPA